jgi:predicted component of type VI protein secretion system
MEAKLIVVSGKTNKPSVRLRLPTVIGRSREAGLTVAHPMISRRHCEIFEADGMLMLRDLGSLNGTLVGGQRVDEVPLRPDDEFTVGPVTFRVVYKCEGRAESAPEAKAEGKQAQRQAAEEEDEMPDFEAVDQTVTAPSAKAGDRQPAVQRPSDSFQWDQIAAEIIADDEGAAGKIDKSADAETKRGKTPPAASSGEPGEDDVKDFLKGLQ